MADRPDEAEELIELFRADVIVPVGDAEETKEFPKRFPHLGNPIYPREPLSAEALFLKVEGAATSAYVLDIHNALAHWHDTPEWKDIDQIGVRAFAWDEDDPLADTFLMHYGDYPNAKDLGIDYAGLLSQATLAIQCRLEAVKPIPIDVLENPSIGYLARHGLHRHDPMLAGWNHAGFFVGDAENIDDLVCFWNLRAADIQLQFLDPAHLDRYEVIRPEYEKQTLAALASLPGHHGRIAVWSRAEILDDVLKQLGGGFMGCPVGGPLFWRAAVRPPMMILGEASSLGIFGQDSNKPRISFSLEAKPFCSDDWFISQHLVASVAVYGGDDRYTFRPPYVPEWNEFFGRSMHYDYHKLRVEPGRIGIVINAAEHDSFLYALPVSALVEQLFASVGLRAKLSPGGLITRQLISRLGGLNGARVFRISGVRRLLKTHGPRDAFTANAAFQLISGKDPENPQASFADYKDLYIEPREPGTELTPQMVFAYLVGKGVFRIGAELTCTSCNLPSWIALDALKQEDVCELCGATFDATRQLVNNVFRYRRTGVLGLEKNTQGAIPVVLALHQLAVNLRGIGRVYLSAPSYELAPNPGVDLPTCEIDFLIMIPHTRSDKAEILIGECKDVRGVIDANDVENLRRIADALPPHRFELYIVFAKLGSFTLEEINLVRTLNGPYHRRVILLTTRELEPWHIYERTAKEHHGITPYVISPEQLAGVTSRIYFSTPLGASPLGA
jgi:hypothetical protein